MRLALRVVARVIGARHRSELAAAAAEVRYHAAPAARRRARPSARARSATPSCLRARGSSTTSGVSAPRSRASSQSKSQKSPSGVLDALAAKRGSRAAAEDTARWSAGGPSRKPCRASGKRTRARRSIAPCVGSAAEPGWSLRHSNASHLAAESEALGSMRGRLRGDPAAHRARSPRRSVMPRARSRGRRRSRRRWNWPEGTPRGRERLR